MEGVLVVPEQIRDSESEGLTLGGAADGFHSCEVHSEFRIQNKSKVLKLGDFVFVLWKTKVLKLGDFLFVCGKPRKTRDERRAEGPKEALW